MPPAIVPLAMPDTSGPGPTPIQAPTSWDYDFEPVSGSARATFDGVIAFTGVGPGVPLVASFNGRSGAVTLTQADVSAVAVGSFNTRTGAVVLTLADVTATGIIPPGTGADFFGTVIPAGWLACDGSIIPRTGANAALFAAIGTTYGAGDGSTTFQLPDCGGRVVAGKEATAGGVRLTVAGAGINGGTLGAAGGVQTYALALGELAAHTHSTTAAFVGGAANVQSGASTNFTQGSITSTSTGSGTAHQNTQPTIVANKIIKL